MKTNQLNKEIQKLNLPDEQKSAILQIIDLKTEDNMEKVLNRMDLIQAEMRSIRDSLQSEIGSIRDSLQSEIGSIRDSLQSEIGSVRDSMRAEISGIKYMIGGLALLITILSIVLTIAFKFL